MIGKKGIKNKIHKIFKRNLSEKQIIFNIYINFCFKLMID